MKQLALLLSAFLALPLAAQAAPQDRSPVVAAQFATAAASCTAQNISPADPHWGPCVNQYLQTNYKYQLMPAADHWLVMVHVISQFEPNMVVLPVALPPTGASWKLSFRYNGTVYRDGNNWCASWLGIDLGPHACSANPEMAFMKYEINLRREPLNENQPRSGIK